MTDTLTRAQVAQLLHVTPKTLFSWEKSGRIPPPRRDWRGWRMYDADAIRAIQAAQTGQTEPSPLKATESNAMPGDFQISARNRVRGQVKSIVGDGVLCEVTLDIGGGQEMVSIITRSSAERLGLKIGVEAWALIKSTEVLLAR